MQFRFSRRAQNDVAEIAEYIARDNPARALTYVRELRAHCRKLTRFPQAAPIRPAFGEGVRVSAFGSYLIFYVVNRDLLEIRRVLHGARNPRNDR